VIRDSGRVWRTADHHPALITRTQSGIIDPLLAAFEIDPSEETGVYREDAKVAKGFKIKVKILYVLTLAGRYP
jgi:hypothetical protein